MTHDTAEDKRPPRALLIGTYKNQADKELCEEHLEELENLTDTFGGEILEKVAIFVRKYEASTYLTKGKLEDMCERAKELNADVIIFDEDLLPSQERNLEALFERRIMNRSEVILEIFSQRAHTKEASLQVELAKTRYQLPRLKRLWTHLEKQSGGALFNKGMGEKQLEVDKRLLRKTILRLEKEIKEVRLHRQTQRQSRKRNAIPSFAIIGYTNAGKSTLLNALTDAGAFVEDKLFATLDTTTRKYSLPNDQEILLIDTVGFIRKIPHTLIAAFKSTLEEATEADILLHLIDITHPMAEEQASTTHAVLKELSAEEKPIITVLNKLDACENPLIANKFRVIYPHTVAISAQTGEGFDDLIHEMTQELHKRRKKIRLRVPQKEYEVVSAIMRAGKVLYQDYEDNDVIISVEVPHDVANRYSEYIF
jgi:GTPase